MEPAKILTPGIYAKNATKGYQLPKHLRYLDKKIVSAIYGDGCKRILVSMPPRHGKLTANSCYVRTYDDSNKQESWSRHGDLQVGDYVFHPSGKPVKVIGTTTESPSDCKVTFTDGSSVKCHENHEWTVYDLANRSWVTVETKYLESQNLKTGFYLPGSFRFRGIRSVAAVERVRPEMGKCIEVDSPDGLYCVTESFIPTHNSYYISEHLPAWHMGMFPDRNIILATYETDFAVSWGRKAKRVLEKTEDWFGVKVDRASAASRWEIKGRKGVMKCSGALSSITGRGAHCAHFRTEIMTRNRGVQRIDSVKVGEEVLGYDHFRKQPRWTRVRAVSTQRKSEFVDIAGAKFTPEHRIYSVGSGYQEAWKYPFGGINLLQVHGTIPKEDDRGSKVDQAEWREDKSLLFSGVSFACETGKVRMPGMFRPKVGVFSGLQSLSQQRQAFSSEMLLLQRGFYSRKCTGSKSQKVQSKERILQSELLPASGGRRPKESPNILEDVQDLRQRWGGVETELLRTRVLLRAEQKQIGLHGRLEQEQQVSSVAGCLLPELRKERDGNGSSSYRSQCSESRNVKSDSVVREMPQPLSSSVLGISANDLKGLLPNEGGEQVVDIQTGTENFFAGPNMILAHNCLIIDDIIKNNEEASSSNHRQKLWDWYRSTAYTRIEPGGVAIVLATRWHEDDVSGRLLQEMEREGGEKWEQINFPAICEVQEDILGRTKGEALWPERYDETALDQTRRTVGAYYWGALYQQRPAPIEGGMFKADWFQEAEVDITRVGDRVRAWDLAATENDGDYTVGVLMGKHMDTGDYWVLDVVRGQWGPANRDTTILRTAKADGKNTKIVIEQEGGSAGKSVIRNLKVMLDGYPVKEYKPTGPKTVRAEPVATQMGIGRVMIRGGQSWFADYKHEMVLFDNGRNDDQVDATAMAYDGIKKRKGAGVLVGG